MRTFDIFDTLIARRCIDPALVFEIVERKVGRPGFARARRQAEKVVSERDYTLDDIYAELANQYSDGERCSCEHDCCGCIRHRILSLKPLKRGEVYLKLQSARNV